MVQQKRGVKTYATLLMILMIVTLCSFAYLNMVAFEEVRLGMMIVFFGSVAMVSLLALGVGLYFVAMAWESWKLQRAKRMAQEREAEVQVVQAPRGQQVYIKTPQGEWWSAHQDPRLYANGHIEEVSQDEWMSHQLYMRAMAHRAPGGDSNVEMPLALPAGPGQNLLTLLNKTQVVFVIGSRDSGKTTLLCHMQTQRLEQGKVSVIDPHSYPGKWPANVNVFGAGRNYGEIEQALLDILQQMDSRFDEISKGTVGERQHPLHTVFIDEWLAITKSLHCGKFAAETIQTLITESRKTAIDMVLASHSDRVNALGVKGAGDLLDGIVFVRLRVSPTTGHHSAIYDDGENKYDVELPGPWKVGPMESFDQKVHRLYEGGMTVSAIAQQVFGSKGGNQNERVKRMLDLV